MKNKILNIVVCTLLIATATLPTVVTMKISAPLSIDEKDLKVIANRLDYSQEEEMAITVENTGTEPVNFNVFPSKYIPNPSKDNSKI